MTHSFHAYFHAVPAALLLLLVAGCGAPKPGEVEALAANGQESLRSGQWEDAYNQLKKAVRALPGNGFLQYDFAQAALRAGHAKEARRAFQTAADLLSGDAAVDALLGLARANADLQRWKDASDVLQRARDYASEARLPDILAALAGVEYRQGLGDAARKHLSDILLNSSPDHPAALYNLGCVFLYHYDDKPAALRAFNRYLRVAKPDPEADARLERHVAALAGVAEGASKAAAEHIRLSRATSSPAEALSLATLAVQEDPLGAEAYINYAERAQAAGNSEAARSAWLRLAHLDPTNPALAKAPAAFQIKSATPFLEKAAIAIGSGNLPAAKSQYIKALEIDPASYDAIRGLMGLLYAQGDTAGATKYAEHANMLRPNRPDVLFYLGCLYAADPARKADAIRAYRLYLQHGWKENPDNVAAVREWLESTEKGTSL